MGNDSSEGVDREMHQDARDLMDLEAFESLKSTVHGCNFVSS